MHADASACTLSQPTHERVRMRVILGVIVSLLAAVSGECTETVSGRERERERESEMKTCSILNTAKVRDNSVLPLLEKEVDDAYKTLVSDKVMKDTRAAKTAFSNYFCVVNAFPCDSTGKTLRLQLCVAMCRNVLLHGIRLDLSSAFCNGLSAKMEDKYFGRNIVLRQINPNTTRATCR